MACTAGLPHVKDALAIGALGERGGVERFAPDAFGDGDAAAGAARALDASDGLPTAAADFVVEPELRRWDGGCECLAAGARLREAGGELFAAAVQVLELFGADGPGFCEPGLGASACTGGFFELLHDLEEAVFELAALGLEELELVLDGGELLRIANGAVVEASFFRLYTGIEVGDGGFEFALAAAELLVAGVGGGEGFLGGLEWGGGGEARVEIGEGGLEGGGFVVDFLERADIGDERHGRMRG